ncbi:Piwi-like protein 1 [Nymphon striatum]|nr:Piwi-like protein 1 [Nymphon striatum]
MQLRLTSRTAWGETGAVETTGVMGEPSMFQPKLAMFLAIQLEDEPPSYFTENQCKLMYRFVKQRDGVGDGQLTHVADYEVPQLLDSLKCFGSDYNPSLTIIIVQKRINARMFLNNGNGLENPSPGSVLDHTVTRKHWYDYFLVSQHVRQGTVSPTHYIVVYDTSKFTPDHIQRLTYTMTHLYYNWPGTIRSPAPCQYAHKLAYLIGQNALRPR